MRATTAITWFEIPAKDLDRAVWFYESVLQQDLRRETMGPAARSRISSTAKAIETGTCPFLELAARRCHDPSSFRLDG